jgi:hypothetical protein
MKFHENLSSGNPSVPMRTDSFNEAKSQFLPLLCEGA